MDIILIHFGGSMPEHMGHCIRQINKFTDDRIIVYAPNHHGNISRLWNTQNVCFVRSTNKFENWKNFGKCNFFDKYKTGGFWRFTCERFFAIEAIMRTTGIPKALHFENDNLIYFPPDYTWLDSYCGDCIGLTRINETLLSGGVTYIGSVDSIEFMNSELCKKIAKGEGYLLKTYNLGMVNEMELLHIIAAMYPDKFRILPFVPDTNDSRYVYDCASWGQFVGGTHQDPDIPFAHDSHIIGRGINNGLYSCRWFESNGIKYPLAINNELKIEKPIFNLHIHSKKLAKWRTYDGTC